MAFKDIGKWLSDVGKLASFILPFIPGLPANLVPFIVNGIQIAETIPNASGPDKLAAAMKEVQNGVAAINTVKPGSVDPNLVNSAVTNGINTVVAVTNLVNDLKK